MTTTMEFKLEGFKELEQFLKQFPEEMAARVVQRSFYEGARVIRDAAKAEAPILKEKIYYKGTLVVPGALRKSIRIVKPTKIIKAASDVIYTVIAGGRRAPHAWLVENGSSPRTQKSGRKTGVMPQNPFMRRALDTKAGEAIARVKSVCTTLVETVATRLAFSTGMKK